MKTLVESLFDDDLVAKKIERIPGTLGWNWKFKSAISYNRIVDSKEIYKVFDKSYMKKHPPTEEELIRGAERWYDKYEQEREKKYNWMAKVIETWKIDDIIDLLYTSNTGLISHFQDSKDAYPGIIDNADITMIYDISRDKKLLTITITNMKPVTREVTFYFEKR